MIVLTRLLSGDLPDRIGPAPVAIAAALVEAGGLLLIASPTASPVALVGGDGDGRRLLAAQPLADADRRRPGLPGRRGAAMGTYTAFFDAGVGLGAPLAGLAAALTELRGRLHPRRRGRLASALLILLPPAPGGLAARRLSAR